MCEALTLIYGLKRAAIITSLDPCARIKRMSVLSNIRNGKFTRGIVEEGRSIFIRPPPVPRGIHLDRIPCVRAGVVAKCGDDSEDARSHAVISV